MSSPSVSMPPCARLLRARPPAHVIPHRRRVYSSSPAPAPAPPRTYLYDSDWHGRLFLSSSKHRNVATAFRDARFLDTFFARLKRNDDDSLDEARQLREQGFEFVSPCQGEMNYLRPDKDGSGLVFQALEDGGAFSSLFLKPRHPPRSRRGTPSGVHLSCAELQYSGSMTMPFDPRALRVDPATGYLFHPSPLPPRTRRRQDAPSRYGPYSLLRSSLVIEHFAKSLELEEEEGGGGTFEYAGEQHRIEPLQGGDVWRRRGP